MAKAAKEKPPTRKQLQESLNTATVELQLAETQYLKGLFGTLTEANTGQLARADVDERNWALMSSGRALTADKDLPEVNRDPALTRKQAYRFWRFNPHARGILRNFQRFIIGREFGFDIDDEHHGQWTDERHTALKETSQVEDPLLARLVWDDFAERNRFIQRAKELVLRSLRDGECFLRRFESKGRIRLRFIEPSFVATPTNYQAGVVQREDFEEGTPDVDEFVGKPTAVSDGVEHLADDVETVVAYHVRKGPQATDYERVPVKDMIHTKPLADANDVRGITILEVVARRLTNYDEWEHYRLVLNKARTAIWLVRRIEGTALQAQQLIAGRSSPRPAPNRLEPVTASARREAMPQPGTTLNPSANVKYEYLTPNLQAADAEHDGRRILLSIAAGIGLPEMLVTGDWSNANYASAVEARTPAVREWEDWQDFFEPVFKQIYCWVIWAAQREIGGLGLPKEVSLKVDVQWPSLVAKDSGKETERNLALNTGGVLSKTTWAAREGLAFEEELENMRIETELEALPGTAGDGMSELDPALDEDPLAQVKTGGGKGNQQQQEARLLAARATLTELAEAVDSTIEDPTMRQAMKRYVQKAMQMVSTQVGESRRRRVQKQWRAGRV